MIKKALTTALILLALHAAIVMMKPVTGSQYPLQQNLVKAQHFIYDETTPNVIIGSSLSNRLVMDSLPHLFNLSFTGLGVFDGLKILAFHKKYPSNIFIEMNIILRKENESFLSYINSPILGPLKKHVPSMRDGYQPLGMLGESIVNKFKGQNSVQPSGENHGHTDGDNIAFSRLLNQEITSHSEMPDKKIMTARFNELQDRIQALEEKGINIIFFEMPVNEKLCDLARPKTIREYFYQYFPPSKYQYINIPDCNDYKTTDGVHLAGEEALKYTKYFRSHADKLLVKGNQSNLK